MRSALFRPVQNLVSSKGGLILAFVWGLAEALWWPIIPDYYVLAVIPAAPRRWWKIGAFTVIGSVIGGAIGFLWAYSRQSTYPMEYAPLVAEGMIHQAGVWLASDGVAGVLRQPLSGIPYKVFVYLAGAGRLNLLAFMAASLAARGARILVAAGVAGLFGRVMGVRRLTRWYDVFLIVFTILFLIGLWKVSRAFV